MCLKRKTSSTTVSSNKIKRFGPSISLRLFLLHVLSLICTNINNLYYKEIDTSRLCMDTILPHKNVATLCCMDSFRHPSCVIIFDCISMSAVPTEPRCHWNPGLIKNTVDLLKDLCQTADIYLKWTAMFACVHKPRFSRRLYHHHRLSTICCVCM